MEPKLFVATKALIAYKGRILLLRESSRAPDGTNVGKYQIPGGRIKPGERYDAGLLREIEEETGLKVLIGKPFFIDEWRPTVRGESWQIVGVFFECEAATDQVRLSDEHDNYLWIAPEEYRNYPVIELRVFEAYLERNRNRNG